MIKLYIIVRTDMASMNAGRVAAQCSHASNFFVKTARETIEYINDPDDQFTKNFNEWENETDQGYGTVIVLDGGSKANIERLMDTMERDYLVGEVIDPEYPIQDGYVVHILKDVFTCAFAFQFGDQDVGALRGLELYGKD